jgi:hypothetical protein
LFKYVNGGYKGATPDEYIDFVLADKFGWTPAQIDEIENKRLENILNIMMLENKKTINKSGQDNGKKRRITTNNFR